MAYNVQQLLKMSQDELDELFQEESIRQILTVKPTALRSSRQERNTAKKSPLSSTGSDGRGKFLMQKRGAEEQNYRIRAKRHYRQGLQGAELARRQGMHRSQLFRDVPCRKVDSR